METCEECCQLKINQCKCKEDCECICECFIVCECVIKCFGRKDEEGNIECHKKTRSKRKVECECECKCKIRCDCIVKCLCEGGKISTKRLGLVKGCVVYKKPKENEKIGKRCKKGTDMICDRHVEKN